MADLVGWRLPRTGPNSFVLTRFFAKSDRLGGLAPPTADPGSGPASMELINHKCSQVYTKHFRGHSTCTDTDKRLVLRLSSDSGFKGYTATLKRAF